MCRCAVVPHSYGLWMQAVKELHLFSKRTKPSLLLPRPPVPPLPSLVPPLVPSLVPPPSPSIWKMIIIMQLWIRHIQRMDMICRDDGERQCCALFAHAAEEDRRQTAPGARLYRWRQSVEFEQRECRAVLTSPLTSAPPSSTSVLSHSRIIIIIVITFTCAHF